jgi:integrase
MASFRKTPNGTWRAELFVNGFRESGTFTTKAQAAAWASQRETELRQGKDAGVISGKTVRDAFHKYEKEVSRTKRGHRFEALRMAALAEIPIGEKRIKFGDIKLSDLTAAHLGQLRDARLALNLGEAEEDVDEPVKAVKGSTVNREFNLLSHVFSTARREWKWISESPTKDVRRPKNPPPRDRRPSADEIERICLSCGFNEEPVTTVSQRVAVAFLFAIETAMRAGEICALRAEWIDGSVAHLPADIIKNGFKRDVPLSRRALQLLAYLPEVDEGMPVFGLTAPSLDALFRKIRGRCAIDGLTFHDTRHEAITRLAKKLNVLELARMVGHRDLKMLQVYYNETAAEIASRLD